MRQEFFPNRESDMVSWGDNFARRLRERADHFGVAEAMLAEFEAAKARFAQAYTLATEPSTRTVSAVAEKNTQRKAMERLARMLASQLRGLLATDTQARIDLGLNVPKPRVRSIAPPNESPLVIVEDVRGTDVTLVLSEVERPRRRARPDGVMFATVYVHVGEDWPADVREWTLGGHFTTTRPTLTFDAALPPGTTVWFITRWETAAARHSPWSTPVCARLGLADLSIRRSGRSAAPHPSSDTASAALAA